MPNIIYLIIGIIIGYLIGKRTMKGGLISEQAEDKKRNLEKILARLSENPKISNDDVQQLLGVSDATATRYLEELELWGHIRQVGRTGKHVTYEKV
jgi:predicted HTH transcriptional regulator